MIGRYPALNKVSLRQTFIFPSFCAMIKINMVKTTAPLFSLEASGLVGPIQFVCGSFAKKMMKPKNAPPSEAQEEQNEKFLDGAIRWKKELTLENRNNWKSFFEIVRQSEECVSMAILMNSYNLWMTYWLKYGLDGWENYPNPPPF